MWHTHIRLHLNPILMQLWNTLTTHCFVDLKVPEPHIARGDIYFAEKQFVDARRVYYETSKMFPESLLPKMKLADVFRAGNELEEAIKVYDLLSLQKILNLLMCIKNLV